MVFQFFWVCARALTFYLLQFFLLRMKKKMVVWFLCIVVTALWHYCRDSLHACLLVRFVLVWFAGSQFFYSLIFSSLLLLLLSLCVVFLHAYWRAKLCGDRRRLCMSKNSAMLFYSSPYRKPLLSKTSGRQRKLRIRKGEKGRREQKKEKRPVKRIPPVYILAYSGAFAHLKRKDEPCLSLVYYIYATATSLTILLPHYYPPRNEKLLVCISIPT